MNEIWSRKTGHKQKIGRSVLGEDAGELVHDLGNPIAVPQRAGAVHWRTDKMDSLRTTGTQLIADLK